ncbi:MAG: DUF3108 domain-containing protein [Chlamydiota bacterium]|nr:DUF3108 domain-containing protein [Chlamydiota bacterium]
MFCYLDRIFWKYLLVFITVLLSVFVSDAQPMPGLRRLIVGEKLTYILRWGMVPVGYATTHVKCVGEYHGHNVYHVVVSAWSNAVFSAFYRVDDRMETFVDVERMIPYKFVKIQNEGRYHSNETMNYDQTQHRAYYRSFLNQSTKQMDIPDDVQDALSSIYYFRTIPLEENSRIMMDVNADEKNWKLEIIVRSFVPGLEIHRMGVFSAFEVEPLAKFKGMYERRGRIIVWISADKRRIPLLVKTKVPFGRVTAALIKIEIDRDVDCMIENQIEYGD